MFGWATNPETGTHHVVLTSVKGEKQTTRKIHQEIVTFYGGAPAFVFGAASHASEEGMPLDDDRDAARDAPGRVPAR